MASERPDLSYNNVQSALALSIALGAATVSADALAEDLQTYTHEAAGHVLSHGDMGQERGQYNSGAGRSVPDYRDPATMTNGENVDNGSVFTFPGRLQDLSSGEFSYLDDDFVLRDGITIDLVGHDLTVNDVYFGDVLAYIEGVDSNMYLVANDVMLYFAGLDTGPHGFIYIDDLLEVVDGTLAMEDLEGHITRPHGASTNAALFPGSTNVFYSDVSIIDVATNEMLPDVLTDGIYTSLVALTGDENMGRMAMIPVQDAEGSIISDVAIFHFHDQDNLVDGPDQYDMWISLNPEVTAPFELDESFPITVTARINYDGDDVQNSYELDLSSGVYELRVGSFPSISVVGTEQLGTSISVPAGTERIEATIESDELVGACTLRPMDITSGVALEVEASCPQRPPAINTIIVNDLTGRVGNVRVDGGDLCEETGTGFECDGQAASNSNRQVTYDVFCDGDVIQENLVPVSIPFGSDTVLDGVTFNVEVTQEDIDAVCGEALVNWFANFNALVELTEDGLLEIAIGSQDEAEFPAEGAVVTMKYTSMDSDGNILSVEEIFSGMTGAFGRTSTNAVVHEQCDLETDLACNLVGDGFTASSHGMLTVEVRYENQVLEAGYDFQGVQLFADGNTNGELKSMTESGSFSVIASVAMCDEGQMACEGVCIPETEICCYEGTEECDGYCIPEDEVCCDDAEPACEDNTCPPCEEPGDTDSDVGVDTGVVDTGNSDVGSDTGVVDTGNSDVGSDIGMDGSTAEVLGDGEDEGTEDSITDPNCGDCSQSGGAPDAGNWFGLGAMVAWFRRRRRRG